MEAKSGETQKDTGVSDGGERVGVYEIAGIDRVELTSSRGRQIPGEHLTFGVRVQQGFALSEAVERGRNAGRAQPMNELARLQVKDQHLLPRYPNNQPGAVGSEGPV